MCPGEGADLERSATPLLRVSPPPRSRGPPVALGAARGGAARSAGARPPVRGRSARVPPSVRAVSHGAGAGPARPALCRRWWGRSSRGAVEQPARSPDPAVPPRPARPPAPVQVPSAFRRGGLKTPRGSPVRPRGRGGGPAWSRGACGGVVVRSGAPVPVRPPPPPRPSRSPPDSATQPPTGQVGRRWGGLAVATAPRAPAAAPPGSPETPGDRPPRCRACARRFALSPSPFRSGSSWGWVVGTPRAPVGCSGAARAPARSRAVAPDGCRPPRVSFSSRPRKAFSSRRHLCWPDRGDPPLPGERGLCAASAGREGRGARACGRGWGGPDRPSPAPARRPAPPSALVLKLVRLLAVDHSARASMKNAASCEN